MKLPPAPKYDLERYRAFIREASPYVSLILGRKIHPEDADRLTDLELVAIALRIDERTDALKTTPLKR